MKKSANKTRAATSLAVKATPAAAVPEQAATFREVVGLIQSARARALQAVNTELIDLYWQVGQYISRKLETAA